MIQYNFKEKVAVITGGASGIGAATATLFAASGARVVVSDIQEEMGKELVSKINNSGGSAIFVKTDVSVKADVSNLFQATIDQYGQLDFGINNAGIEGLQGMTGECTEENWDKVIGINLKGAWFCMEKELNIMLKQKKGCIVNISSIAGVVGFNNLPAYVASKHGLIGLTKTAALEYADKGIRVNAICPGVIQTPMVDRFIGDSPEAKKAMAEMAPIHRMGSPKEIAASIAWLCSEDSGFVTGHAMVADGGFTAR